MMQVSWVVLACGLSMLELPAPAEGRTRRRVATGDRASHQDHQECLSAFFAGQELVEADHLRQARGRFLTCADPRCGSSLQQDCQNRYTQLGADIPSVIPLATDGEGTPMVDVAVTIDGEPLARRLDGRAIPVDPGLHLFSFTADGDSQEVKVMIVQGQRNRVVSATFDNDDARDVAAAPAAQDNEPASRARRVSPFRRLPQDHNDVPLPPRAGDDDRTARARSPRNSAPSRWPYYLLGGVGVTGLAGYGLLVSWAQGDNSRLAQCSPNCPQASVDHIHKLYTAANVSLGIGLSAMVATTTIYLLSGPKKKEKDLSYSFNFRPSTSGAVASVGGVF